MAKKYRIQQKTANGLQTLHPETDSTVVQYSGTIGSTAVTNVKDALDAIETQIGGLDTGVISVNGETGVVTLDAADVGAEAAFTDGSATIASKNATTGVVTIKAGVSQLGGAIANSSGTDITLGTAANKTATTSMSGSPSDSNILTEKAVSGLLADKADKTATVSTVAYDGTNKKITKTINGTTTDVVSASTLKTDMALNNVTNNKQVKGLASGTTSGHVVTWGSDGYTVADSGKAFTTTVNSSSTDAQIPTAKAVYDAIDALPEPMVFKGSVGTGGTVTALPVDGSASIGDTYKVITAGTYAGKTAAVGDTFICLTKTSSANTWELIPSGDEPSGTVTNINATGAENSRINVTGGPISSSGTLTIGIDSGYSIPSDTDQAAWSAKQDALAAQTAYTAKGAATKVPQITTNALGQVTNITEVSITDNNQAVKAGDVTFGANDVVNFVAGSNVTVTGNATNKTITIASSYTDTNQTVKVGTSTFGTNTAVNFVAGSNVTITPDTANGKITIAATDTTYESKTAASGGTDVSLVTTGEKYTWNNKYAKPSGGIPSSDLATSGVTAGTYSAVTVNNKGIVTSGGNLIEIGTTTTDTPSANLATGGLFFAYLAD